MVKKILGFAYTVIIMGVLAAIAIIAIFMRPKQSVPLSGGQLTQTQAPTLIPTSTLILTPTSILTPTPISTPTVTTSALMPGNCTLRTQTITYTVKSGDTIAGIASYYCLKPETILWANYNLLGINNASLMVGIIIDIPVKDGEFFWVPPSSGQNDLGLVIPLEQMGPGACQNPTSSFTGTGTFLWPTKLHAVSGYDFSPGIQHFGIDLAGNQGDQVYASDGGVVVFAGWSNLGYGYMVVIDHGSEKQTLYAHLSSVDVACDEHLEQGSPIGKVGSSGNAYGPALHFEIIVNNERVNPHEYLPSP